jgi:DNA-binding GntR family transcriptional regulator
MAPGGSAGPQETGNPDAARPGKGSGSRRPSGVTRTTAAGTILTALRGDILRMALLPGMPLVERELIERFGVSRTPVREALIRLAEDGLVDIFPQSGTFVSRIPIEALPEAVVIRQALEVATIPLAISRASEADFAALDAIIARQDAMAKLGDQDAFHAADEAFHEVLAWIAGHPGLWRVAQQAKLQIDRCRRLTLPAPGRMAHVIDEHRGIVAALRARDVAAASSAMRMHLNALIPDVTDLRATYPQYFI